QRRARNGLDLARIAQTVDVELADLDAVVAPGLRRYERREQAHRVLRLLLADGHSLHPGRRLLAAHRPVAVPVVEGDRREAGSRGEASGHRVFAVPLAALEHRRVVGEVADLVNGEV